MPALNRQIGDREYVAGLERGVSVIEAFERRQSVDSDGSA
jgi:hypothetical protein